MNKKAQTGPIAAIILFLVYIINWFIWLGDFINVVGNSMITTNNLTGVEAFFFANLNFSIFIIMLLAMMGWAYFGSE